MIDYIQEQTPDFEKIAYVGHSMGTTIMFRLAAERPSYVEDNISTFVCLGPVLVPTHSTSPIVHMVIPYQKSLYKLFTRMGYYEIGEPT